jgi:hypothetical protein
VLLDAYFLTGVGGGSGVSAVIVEVDGNGQRDLGCKYSSASIITSGPSIDDDKFRINSFSSYPTKRFFIYKNEIGQQK